MRSTIPIVLGESHKGVHEMQVSIRVNTYRSFGYTIAIAALAALFMTALVMMSTKPKIETIFNRIAVTPTSLSMISIPNNERASPHTQLQGVAFINRFDTVMHETPVLQQQIADVKTTQGTVGTSTLGSSTASTVQGSTSSTMSSIGTTSTVITRPPDEGDDQDIEFSEVEPSVDVHELHSKLEYPVFLQRAGVEGEVRIAVLVSENGKVSATKVLQSTDERFCASALSAIQRTSFRPGMNNGTAVKSWVVIPIIFSLR